MRSTLVGAVPDDIVDGALLVAGELVANALEHGSAPASLELSTTGANGVEVSVFDGGGETALSAREPSPDVFRGRGLAIVAAVASEWGVERAPDGKRVWALITPGRHG